MFHAFNKNYNLAIHSVVRLTHTKSMHANNNKNSSGSSSTARAHRQPKAPRPPKAQSSPKLTQDTIKILDAVSTHTFSRAKLCSHSESSQLHHHAGSPTFLQPGLMHHKHSSIFTNFASSFEMTWRLPAPIDLPHLDTPLSHPEVRVRGDCEEHHAHHMPN